MMLSRKSSALPLNWSHEGIEGVYAISRVWQCSKSSFNTERININIVIFFFRSSFRESSHAPP